MKLNVKSILDGFKLVGYILLLIADEVITVRSFYSVGEFFLAGFGGVIVLIGAWVFLDAIRRKGAEKWLKLIAWGGSVLLIVFLNWAFVLSSITVQSADVTSDTKAQTFATTTNERQITQALDTIDMYTRKLADLNKWQDKERKDISDRISEQNALIAELKPKKSLTSEVKENVKTTEVFRKMSTLFGGNESLTSSAWWILAFLVAQLFTVLAAPKANEDAPIVKRKRRRRRKPEVVPVAKTESERQLELFDEFDDVEVGK
jgi:hypothetical protein